MANEQDLRGWVSEYYGKVLAQSADLKTNACACSGGPPAHLKAALSNVHLAVSARFYGCGYPVPLALKGARVLDLGCGSGRDVYLLSQLVGPEGFVHGLDMTAEQLALASTHVDWHMQRFGYSEANVRFHRGYIEELDALPIEPGSLDLIVSNCVVNLSPRKDLVLQQVFKMLKPGGEFYFSDVFCDRRLPEAVASDRLLHAECLGGAMYFADFLDLAKRSGFGDPRTIEAAPITIQNAAIEAKVGAASFRSITVRLFKLEELDTQCEDYGQLVTYKGTIEGAGPLYWLDDHHLFEAGCPERVCRNTAAMLSKTRLAPHFELQGAAETHFGILPCGMTTALERNPVRRKVSFSIEGASGESGDQGSGGCCGSSGCC